MMITLRKYNRLLLFVIIILLITIIIYKHEFCRKDVDRISNSISNINNINEKINCDINEEYTIECLYVNDNLFMPFSFIQQYFDVYGKFNKKTMERKFFFQHSYSRVIIPNHKHTASSQFMTFEFYNVEIRDRVKCISAIDGVPISTQWGAQGHFYPIQIAQYGLSHYSKFIVEREDNMYLEKFAQRYDYKHFLQENCKLRGLNKTINYECESFGSISLSPNLNYHYVHLSVDWKMETASMLRVEVYFKSGETFFLYYIQDNRLIETIDNNIYYGLGKNVISVGWFHFTRNVLIDIQKGLAFKQKKGKKKNYNKLTITIKSIKFIGGSGFIANLTLASEAHLDYFYYASRWLVENQDEKGGWKINVDRHLADGLLQLKAGWYSAMAQGQAMSLLCRAYKSTGKLEYLQSATKAAYILSMDVDNGGVRSKFVGKYVWYEEYPTKPSSFVLNGFIYALLGLYDVKSLTNDELTSRLYDEGMESLKALLALFDTGSGSLYDLRHFSLPGIAPNLARWDYHSTHINQLLLLSTIDNSKIFTDISNRWQTYMKGHKAKHN